MSESETTTPLPWYSRILVNYQHLTLALLIGICFGLAVSLLALDSGRDSAAQALAAEHASDIARLGADQSSQSLFNNDLLSLQVLLTSLVQLDQIQGLTVHDVENRLLAQAGSVAADDGIYRSASITQNDSVAGYLTVIAHKPGKTTSRNIWFAIFALAMGIILSVLLKRQLPFLQNDQEPLIDDGPDDFDDREISIEQSLSTSDRTPIPDSVALTLESERLNEVAQQLDENAFSRVLDELNRHINSVSSLYGARQITAGHTLPVLLFDSKDGELNTINALCSAQLLLALSYRMKTPLSLHAQVEEYHRDGKLADHPERFKASNKTLFLGIAAPLAERVQDRFQFREDNGYWLETEEFDESFQGLLDNQLKQLLKTSGYDMDSVETPQEGNLPPAEEEEFYDEEVSEGELLIEHDDEQDYEAEGDYQSSDYVEDNDDYDSEDYDGDDYDEDEFEFYDSETQTNETESEQLSWQAEEHNGDGKLEPTLDDFDPISEQPAIYEAADEPAIVEEYMSDDPTLEVRIEQDELLKAEQRYTESESKGFIANKNLDNHDFDSEPTPDSEWETEPQISEDDTWPDNSSLFSNTEPSTSDDSGEYSEEDSFENDEDSDQPPWKDSRDD